MPEHKKAPTNFTIDCILRSDSDFSRSPTNHPMNKVLDNPWISKCPLALTFTPSTHKKFNVPPSPINPILQPNFFNIFNPPTTINYTENILNFTSVHNHFYRNSSNSESTSNSDDFKVLPKIESFSEEKSSDSDGPSDNLSLNENHAVDLVILSSESAFKCSVCSKSFENCDLLDVG
jgi:hypothetical protein